MSVTPQGDSVELGRPQMLFLTQAVGTGTFDVSADGKRFLLMQAPLQNSSSLTLVVNWQSTLNK